MTTPRSQAKDSSFGSDLLHAVRYYFGRRRTILAFLALALVGGLAFNWNWLVAVGVAPLLLSALPCVVMCSLGLCMKRMTGGACSSEKAEDEDISAAVPQDHSAETLEATSSKLSAP